MGEGSNESKKRRDLGRVANRTEWELERDRDPASGTSLRVDENGGPPTIIPAFDPNQYAEESEIRERMPTLTDEVALEQARQQSFPTNYPPARGPLSTRPGAVELESELEIDAGEADLEQLDVEEQVAILRARLAPLQRVPTLAKSLSELGALLEDPKSAYVLGFVDGILPLETIVEVTGLPELDTLRILDRALGHGAVLFRSLSPPRGIRR